MNERKDKPSSLEELIISKHIYTNGGTDNDQFVTIPIKDLAQALSSYICEKLEKLDRYNIFGEDDGILLSGAQEEFKR